MAIIEASIVGKRPSIAIMLTRMSTNHVVDVGPADCQDEQSGPEIKGGL